MDVSFNILTVINSIKTVFIHGQSVIGTYYHPGLKILPLWTVSRTDYLSVITKLVLHRLVVIPIWVKRVLFRFRFRFRSFLCVLQSVATFHMRTITHSVETLTICFFFFFLSEFFRNSFFLFNAAFVAIPLTLLNGFPFLV